MRRKHLLLACTIIARAVSVSAFPTSAGADTERQAKDTVPARPEAQLKKGAPADAVINIMGLPREKTPMKVSTGKAEVWVYMRPVSDVASQIEVGAKQITDTVVGGDGMARTVVVATEPIYKMTHRIAEDEVSLLMFNDHFVQAKTIRRERRVMD